MLQEVHRAQGAERQLEETVVSVVSAVEDNCDAISYETLRALERESELETDIAGKISGQTVVWGVGSNIDNYVTQGFYIINGEHIDIADGLPLLSAAPGRTVAATLVVVDSTASSAGRCVTQLLVLSDRVGAAGNLYMRTGTGDASGMSWGTWGRMLSAVDVGQVSSLESFTDNGIYSGVCFSDSSVESFMMIVINNSVVAGSINLLPSVSQFKYALAHDGTVSLMKRTGSAGLLGSWEDINAPLGGYGDSRPSAPRPGCCFFDSTLGKPIWWSGSSWVDALGVVV